MSAEATTKRDSEIQAARDSLRRKGWSQRTAAPRLGVSRPHLTLVLNGHRRSRRLLEAIEGLPENPTPAPAAWT